jgi:hypothetical protein
MDRRGGSTPWCGRSAWSGTADYAKIAAIDVLEARLLDGSDAVKRDPDDSVLAAKFSVQVCPTP